MKIETKVGLLFTAAIAMVVIFAWLMGVVNPFTNTYNLYVQYNFAGGIEIGSPVRVMGIKIGKVERIDFVPDQKDSQGNEVKLKIKISVDKKAKETIRKGSKFFINLAGIIGEKSWKASALSRIYRFSQGLRYGNLLPLSQDLRYGNLLPAERVMGS